MTNKPTIDEGNDEFNPEEIQMDFFFWLGLDGELKALNGEEGLEDAIDTERDRIQRWLNVDVSTL